MSIESLVLLDKQAGVATVTLNRPEAMNALSTGLRQAITRTFVALKDDADARVIVLTGAGRAFCAGLDLKELGGEKPADSDVNVDTDIRTAVERVGKPVIGAINGVAITGGFELALMCDFMLASPNAKFADTHGRVGVVPGWGLSQKLPRLIGVMRAKELSLTGNFLNAETAERWGLVNRIVDADALIPTCQALARDIISCDPTTMGHIRNLIDTGWHTTLAEGLHTENEISRQHSKARVTPESVRARREAIQIRGRTQAN